MPDILEAFNHSQAAAAASAATSVSSSCVRNLGGDPWELPELKWLDHAEVITAAPATGETLPAADCRPSLATTPEKYPVDGERWSTFASLYPRDRVEGVQFSLQSLGGGASTAGSVSSALMNGRIDMSSRSRELPSSSSQIPPVPSSRAGKRRPDSDFGLEKLSNSERSKPDGIANAAQALASTNNDVSGLLTSSYPPKKRCKTGGAVVARGDGESSGHDLTKGVIEKGSASGTNDQAASPGRDSKKSATPTVSDHEIHIWTERERRKKMNGMFSTLHSLLPHLTSKTISRLAYDVVRELEGQWEKESGENPPALGHPNVPAESSQAFSPLAPSPLECSGATDMDLTTFPADKSTIVDEAINYIQSLEVTMKGLMKRKGEMTNSSSKLVPTSLSRLQALQHGTTEENNVCKVSPTIPTCGETRSSDTASATQGSQAQFQTQCSKNVVLNTCGKDAFISICNPRGRLGLLSQVLFVLESHNLFVNNAHICTSNDTIMYMVHAQSTGGQLVNTDTLNIALQDIVKCPTPHMS
ncbi:hypothetical protein R1sor_015187 [Riccia sorocarpa]|uniref:BHLH domain-containing protein n=1 Tax=Riccia sorocarpa TaxID=122646 RepID=A0ABD3HBK2_9MARC